MPREQEDEDREADLTSRLARDAESEPTWTSPRSRARYRRMDLAGLDGLIKRTAAAAKVA